VCKETAMKPVRRLMNTIENTTDEECNWSVIVNPKDSNIDI
jgi:hypothetical protein